jgi:hypothetical protein
MTTRPLTHTAPAVITQATIALAGDITPDVTVLHARTTDARITVTLGGVLLVFYNCAAVQGLRAAFGAARPLSARLPEHVPTPQSHPAGQLTVAVEWTRSPNYAVAAQSALTKARTHTLHWIDVYTAAITWQIRDRAALAGVLDGFARLHAVAVATFLDGADHSADPDQDPALTG